MSLVITGANALVKLSGEVVLFAGGVSVEHENRLKEIPQLDNLEVAEWMENGHRCTITIRHFKLAPGASIGGQQISNTATDFNLDFHPANSFFVPFNPLSSGTSASTAAGVGVPINFKKLTSSDIKQLLLQPEIIIEIVTDVGGEESAIYVGTGCKFAGGSGELDARGVWNGVWNFKCKRGTGI
jgi:hypothetical protein